MRGWCVAGLAEVGGGAVHSVADLGLFLRAVAYCQQRYDTSKPPSLTRAVVTSKAASKAAIESSGSQQYPCVCVCVRALCCAVAALDRVEESRMDPTEFSKAVRTMVSKVFAARMHWHCTQCTARAFCRGVPNCILKRLS
jgi:hypothetical protein